MGLDIDVINIATKKRWTCWAAANAFAVDSNAGAGKVQILDG